MSVTFVSMDGFQKLKISQKALCDVFTVNTFSTDLNDIFNETQMVCNSLDNWCYNWHLRINIILTIKIILVHCRERS